MASIVREDVPVHMVRPSLEAIPADELPPGFAVRRWREPADSRAWEQIWHEANAAHYERCRSLPWLARGETVLAGGQPVRAGSFEFVYGEDRDLQGQRNHFLLAPDGQPIGIMSSWGQALPDSLTPHSTIRCG